MVVERLTELIQCNQGVNANRLESQNDSIIDIMKNQYKFKYTYRDYTTRITVDFPMVEINTCLQLKLDASNLSCYVAWIGTHSSECPLPDKDRGKWIVGLIDDLMCHLGISHLKLLDGSRVLCHVNHTEINFFLLRTFQGRASSWYENFGYLPIVPCKIRERRVSAWLELGLIDQKEHDELMKHLDELTDDYTRALYLEGRLRILNRLSNYPISDFLTDIEDQINMDKPDYMLDDLSDEYISILEQYYPDDYETLGLYLTAVWKDNCNSYSILTNMLLQNKKRIGKLMKMYFTYIKQMYSKQLNCSPEENQMTL